MELYRILIGYVKALEPEATGAAILELSEEAQIGISLNTIYVVLDVLEDQGYVTSHFEPCGEERSGRNKKVWQTTGKNYPSRESTALDPVTA